MSESRTNRYGYGPAFWCVIVLLALEIYVGVYVAVMERVEGVWFAMDTRLYFQYDAVYSSHRSANRWLTRTFAPLNIIDRKIRPDYWKGNREAHFEWTAGNGDF